MKSTITRGRNADGEHREIAGDLSAYSLRREREDRDHHAAPAGAHERVDADHGARCAPRHGSRGLIAEHGISWMLPRIVGHANALDLLMSARRVSSDEALRIGLVNRLYPPDQLREQTYAYARDLADFVSPSAIAVIKRQLYDVPFQTLAEATIDANREMVVALRGSDFREGVASFMEKRPPRFTGK